MINFFNQNSIELLDVILQGSKQSDEAMYYILQDRLRNRLQDKFDKLPSKISDDFSDVLNDFFLYLREGNETARLPYSALHTIRNKASFETWIVSTFWNFLNKQYRKKQQELMNVDDVILNDGSEHIEKEELISKASILIAYSHQSLPPRSQFLLLRTLLTLLDKDNALPDKEMAEAMGMSHILYRVTTHRIMKNVRKLMKRIESGDTPDLDNYHANMAASINKDFDTLYATLMRYYSSTLGMLDNEGAISKLRKRYYESTGTMLHEDSKPYGILSIYGFYNKLTRYTNLLSAA